MDFHNLELLANVAHIYSYAKTHTQQAQQNNVDTETVVWELDHEQSRIVYEIQNSQGQTVKYWTRWACTSHPDYNHFTDNVKNCSYLSKEELLRDAPGLILRFEQLGKRRQVRYVIQRIEDKRLMEAKEGKRKKKVETEYLVNWGGDIRTWEPRARLVRDGEAVHEAIKDYELMKRAASRILRKD